LDDSPIKQIKANLNIQRVTEFIKRTLHPKCCFHYERELTKCQSVGFIIYYSLDQWQKSVSCCNTNTSWLIMSETLADHCFLLPSVHVNIETLIQLIPPSEQNGHYKLTLHKQMAH